MTLLRPALFLDRDGVINVDHGYVYQQAQFQFVDNIFDLCRYAKSAGYLVVIITNQAGIGRGYYTEQDFWNVTEWMCKMFAAQAAAIDKVYFCPSHPEHGVGKYKFRSAFRKPAPGMILQAVKEFDIDLSNSVLIGDKESDIQAGLAAGVESNLLYHPRSLDVLVNTAAKSVLVSLLDAKPFLM